MTQFNVERRFAESSLSLSHPGHEQDNVVAVVYTTFEPTGGWAGGSSTVETCYEHVELLMKDTTVVAMEISWHVDVTGHSGGVSEWNEPDASDILVSQNMDPKTARVIALHYWRKCSIANDE